MAAIAFSFEIGLRPLRRSFFRRMATKRLSFVWVASSRTRCMRRSIAEVRWPDCCHRFLLLDPQDFVKLFPRPEPLEIFPDVPVMQRLPDEPRSRLLVLGPVLDVIVAIVDEDVTLDDVLGLREEDVLGSDSEVRS